MKPFSKLLENSRSVQRGINMVDLMMWLVIAALLLATAIQSIGYYQKSAYIYQMREAIEVASSRIMALAANDGSVDYEDAVEVIAEENAASPNDGITLTIDNIRLTAAGEPGGNEYGFELASAVTAAPTALETFYIRAAHTSVLDKDVVHYFKDTASKKVGTHIENKGNGSGGDSGDETTPEEPVVPDPEATPTPEPTPTPTPEPEPEPVNEFASINFTQQANSQGLNYYGAASSADGNTLYAAANIGNIYRSTDSGATWTALSSAGNRGWYGLATNAAGTKIIATSWAGLVYVSNDSGATWTPTTLPSQEWREVAMTPDGSKIIASYTVGSGDGNLYVSTDGGATWTVQKGTNGAPLNSRWYDVDLSDDGQTMVAASTTTTQIWKTTNGGATWTLTGPSWSNRNYGVAISANGQTIAIGQYNGGIVTTTDGGTTWNPKPGGINSDYYRLSMSDDGTKMVATGWRGDATATPNGVYASSDSGVTWTQQSTLGTAQWFSSAMSADGKKMLIGSISGRKLWTGVWGPAVATTEPSGTVTTASIVWGSQSTAGTTDTYDMAMTADGTKIVAAKFGNAMFKSVDSGATWTSMGNSSADRRSVAMSADGSKILTGQDGYYSYLSKDGGATWTQAIASTLAQGWYTAMSADGNKMYVANSEGTRFWSSANAGTTWTSATAPNTAIIDLAVSDDGATLIAGTHNQQPLKSTDGGATWSYISGLPFGGQWYGLDLSEDGSKMVAADFASNGSVWTSYDAGATWKKLTLPATGGWRNASISSDGMKLTAMRNNNGNIYTSKDAGATWTTETSQGTGSWRSVAASNDGTKVFFGGSSGKIARGTY